MRPIARLPVTCLVSLALGLTACQPGTPTGTQAGPVDPGAEATAPGATAAPATSPAAAAPGGNELDEATLSIVKGSTAIAASAVACGMGTQAQADQGVASQRESIVARGFSGDAYDRASKAAWSESNAKFAAASATQKAEACASMRKLGGQLQQMADDVKTMQEQQR